MPPDRQPDVETMLDAPHGSQSNQESADLPPAAHFSWMRVLGAVMIATVIALPAIYYFGTSTAAQPGARRPRPTPHADFDLSNTTIAVDQIVSGGPPVDGIPAISDPEWVAGAQASFLAPEDRVIGVGEGEFARAFPIKVLNYHEIVNDRVNDVPIAVTYCPLCDSAAVFDRRTPLGEREFGVSGLLYNSNVLMYDRSKSTPSLWSQLAASGVSGPGANKSLQTLPLELTTWQGWFEMHPKSQVLSTNTGHQRNYDRNPYDGYFRSPRLTFSAQPTSNALPTKERVLGIWSGDRFRAYPQSAFGDDRATVESELDGKRVAIEWIADSKTLRVAAADDGIQWMYSLWFAWYAMHPETEIYSP